MKNSNLCPPEKPCPLTLPEETFVCGGKTTSEMRGHAIHWPGMPHLDDPLDDPFDWDLDHPLHNALHGHLDVYLRRGECYHPHFAERPSVLTDPGWAGRNIPEMFRFEKSARPPD